MFNTTVGLNNFAMNRPPRSTDSCSYFHVAEQCRRFGGDNTKPSYGCQVTIHSEQEKQLMKLCRREEKRSARREKRTGDDGDVFIDGGTCFDPKELRVQR